MPYKYEQVFAFVEKHTDEFVGEVTRSAKRFNVKFQIIRPLVLLVELLKPQKKVEILFNDDRFDYLIKLVTKKADVGLMYGFCSLRVLWKDIKSSCSFCTLWRERFLLNRAFLCSCEKKRSSLVEKAVGLIEKKIIGFDPKVLVLWGDSLFLNRAIICAARNVDVPTVVLQHGVILDGISLNYLDGTFGDYFFTWSKSVKKYYIENNLRDEDTIRIMGYQFKHNYSNSSVSNFKQNLKICIFGQGLWEYYEEFKYEYFKVIENILTVCKELKVQILYRPHPAENLEGIENRVPKWCLVSRAESLPELFDSYNVFLGFNSTALIEATIYGKVSAQIRTTAWASKDFESSGYAYTLGNSKAEIKDFLQKVAGNQIVPMQINKEYIELPSDIEESFLACLDDIGIRVTRSL